VLGDLFVIVYLEFVVVLLCVELVYDGLFVDCVEFECLVGVVVGFRLVGFVDASR